MRARFGFVAAIIAAAMACSSGVVLAQTPLKVGVVSRTIFYLPAWTAEQQGFFKAEGLEPKIEVYNDAHKIFTDLKAGTIQIGISSIESV
ncbi:MAG TPA: ABC transporter substrate-binding protein, partial [Pseudolabrys sp.]